MKLTFLMLAACFLMTSSLSAANPRVAFQDNPADGEMHIVVDGQDALVYQYRDGQDLVHFFPVQSPFGQSMTAQKAELTAKLIWEYDGDKPLLDERRSMRVVALGDGQWLLDITFTLTANYGDVEFVSDAAHYGWPYVRMNSTFSVEGGGTITSSEGGVNQAGTDGKNARWIDYVNTVDGKTSGLAIFPHPSTGPESPKWLTRD